MSKSFVRLLSLLLFSLPALHVAAQSGPYGNEWIDYSKTYYKFKVGKTGVCRIYRSALSAAGVPAGVVGSNFTLYRDGQEVPVFVSNENMGANDYIEFWGRKADGEIDKELYVKPEYQPSDRTSLFSDSASYFLTYDNGNNHLRYAATPNNIPATPPAPEPYCIATVGYYPKSQWVPGPSYAGTTNLLSPSFDNGEGFIDAGYSVYYSQLNASLQTPNLVSGVGATLHAGIVVRSYVNSHQIRTSINGSVLDDASLGNAEAKHYDLSVPANALAAINQIQFSATPKGSAGDYDLYGISFAELDYPRNFDMSGLDQAAFKLPATGSPQYVEFLNMGAGRLYDVTNQKWYNGNVAANKTRFYLDPSVLTRQIIVLADAANVSALVPVKSVQFTDWGAAASQSDFVMITHRELMQQTNGHNYVQDYASYRSSAAGGNHTVAVADVTELYDQFAYGYDIHPISIRHFLNYAYDKWTRKPKDAFLIGRGIYYYDYPRYLANRSTYTFPIVPTWGVPGSDINFVMFNGEHSPKMHIGRLTVWKPQEIGVYLNKVQTAEQLAAPAQLPTLATELWKKRAIHMVGTNAEFVRLLVEPVMAAGAAIIRDTFTGKSVTTFTKASSAAVDQVNAQLVDSLLRGGVSQISFYGHGSPFTFDYALPDPESYSNGGRMSSFLALGCDIAQMFDLATQRTITERYLLAPNAGAITVIASANSSFTGFDDYYLYAYYRSMAYHNYGAPVGTHFNFAYDSMTHTYIGGQDYPNNYSTQLESTLISGDPSTSLPAATKPDYHVLDDGISSIPNNITTALDTFQLRIASYNLGKAIHDTVTVKVEHVNPAGSVALVTNYKITNLYFSDTTTIKIPIDKVADLGLNKYKVTIDAGDRYDEVSELNNTATFDIFIYSDNLIPVYPPEFAIVHDKNVTLKASVLNAFRPMARYRLEMDTTELFNSPLKQSTTINSSGGVVKWTSDMQLQDSTVYYWRAAYDSAIGGTIQWSNSSFIYLANAKDTGWNQSHYYQFLKDYPAGLSLRPDRKFSFGSIINKVVVKNMVLCYGGSSTCNASGSYMNTFYNTERVEQSSYNNVWNAISIMVIDSATGRPWQGTPPGSTPPSSYRGIKMHQFDLSSASTRLAAAHYLDSIPNGDYVVMKNAYWLGISSPFLFINAWKADTAIAGPGHSLYHSIYNLGFTKIDSFYKERVFVFARRKGDPTWPVYQGVTDSLTQYLDPSFDIKGSDVAGQYASTVIGPAKSWEAFKWKTFSLDSLMQNDTSSVAIIGVDKNGIETMLYPHVVGDTSLSTISAQQYPKLRLMWSSKDSLSLSSPQLAYWRVLYRPLPEAALNPASYFVFSDSLSQGQMQTFSTAIENLTPLPMDSVLVRYKVIGSDGISHLLANKRYPPLKGLDTMHASITFDPAPYPGKNLFFVEANPDNDQPELYHPNNLGYVPFRIGVDNNNPLMDVTFDGVHILNGDIVSSRPFIKVRLKDDNRFLALDDTSLLKVYLRYPSDSVTATTHLIPFDGTRCRFIPATKTDPINEAFIEFRPELVEDGTYQLSVSGVDKSGNAAGGVAGGAARPEYKISFEVDNKPSITNVLNYPNPFSTKTAFVFTLTGWQIPSQLKIQILTVTGKVVREITRDELGPLHIGRNITDYKWDGRDQYGQLLGNGVYLYRVVTSLNGQDMDLRADTHEMTRSGGGIDKYFKNGYGKMYIMR